MSTVLEKHREAMAFTDDALSAKRTGEADLALSMFRQAFECERVAAELYASENNEEPTRSVLYRSAATLALDCGEYREAERLVARALSGDPPEEIAQELRDVLDRTYKIWGVLRRKVATR